MRREALIARLRERLLEEGAPRLTMSLLVLLSGGAAFLFSALSLRAGIESMGLRYLLAALVAYGAFLLCIRLWIAYRRRQLMTRAWSDALVPLERKRGGKLVIRSISAKQRPRRP